VAYSKIGVPCWYLLGRTKEKHPKSINLIRIEEGRQRSDLRTSNISDLLCSPVPKHSAGSTFSSVQQLADGDVSRATWLQEVWPRCLNLKTARASRSQRTSCLTTFRSTGLQQTLYNGTFAVGNDTATTHKTYISYRNFTTFYYRFKVCESVHHRTIEINHQSDATIFQFIFLTFIYSSTCFGRFLAHHQELNDCSGSLWFYLRVVVIVVGPVITGPTTNTARLSP
jgi:hypothetical protein